ncbi:MAG: hypothetical protein F7C34_00835 [Desulfurococcales archaeon]|nr:hypothetical protein [Desulfurococcales archaeon]
MPSRVLITTTRRPSPRTRSLVRDLVSTIPGAVRLTRGHMNTEELAFEAISRGVERVLIIGTRRGNPSIARFYKPKPPRLEHLGTLIIRGVTLSREARTTFNPPRDFDTYQLYVWAEDVKAPTPHVAEVLVKGLKASVMVPGARVERGVVAAVRSRGDYSEITFYYEGRRVGPVLRVVLPRGGAI